MEWHKFPEGEEPTVLTSISEYCNAGEHDKCPGIGFSAEHGGQPIFCVCDCHKKPVQA